MIEHLKGLKGMVIVSGYRSELYDKLFYGWHREDKVAMADGARPRTESLWFSPNFLNNSPNFLNNMKQKTPITRTK